MDYLLVAAGGAAGSLVRFLIGRQAAKKARTGFPVGTFIINITGAILLGIVSTIRIGENAYILVGEGFLGAYTTFSTFMYEGFNLIQDNRKMNAAIYITGSVVLGMIGFIIGVIVVKLSTKQLIF